MPAIGGKEASKSESRKKGEQSGAQEASAPLPSTTYVTDDASLGEGFDDAGRKTGQQKMGYQNT